MRIRFQKENWLLLLSAACMIVNTSAFLGYQAEVLVHDYLKYALSAAAVVLLLVINVQLLLSRKNQQDKRVQMEWFFFAAYAALHLLQHQILEDNSGKAFGLSSYTILGIQNAATFLIGSFVILGASKAFCRRIIWVFMALTAIDCLYSLSVLSVNDQALRISSWQSGVEELAEQGLFGICNALHVYAFLVMLPGLLMLMKYQQRLLRLVTLALVVLIVVLIFSAGYTMAMALMVIYGGYRLFCRVTEKPALRVLALAGLVLVVAFVDWAAVLLQISEMIGNAAVKERVVDLHRMLTTGEQGNAIGSRITAYTKGLTGFINSPVIGNVVMGERMISGHSTLLDMLSDWGLFGFTLYMLFIYFVFKCSKQYLLRADCDFYRETALLYVMTILLNTLGRYSNGSAVIAVFFPAVIKYVLYEATERCEAEDAAAEVEG